MYQGMIEGLKSYQIPIYKGKLYLLIAQDNPAKTEISKELLGWEDYAPDITAIELSGSHYDVFNEENIRKIHHIIENH